MSVGFFIGYLPRTQDGAVASVDEYPELPELREELRALSFILQRKGLPSYQEPEVVPDPYVRSRLGRSPLDHTGSGSLKDLPLYGATRRQLVLLRDVDQVVFHPLCFDDRPECVLPPRDQRTTIGSLPRLRQELVEMAPRLGIPLSQEGLLDDKVAKKIGGMKRLGVSRELDGDDEVIEFHRTNWLLVFEAARLALERCCAMVLRS
jgi:hypothetical protein